MNYSLWFALTFCLSLIDFKGKSILPRKTSVTLFTISSFTGDKFFSKRTLGGFFLLNSNVKFEKVFKIPFHCENEPRKWIQFQFFFLCHWILNLAQISRRYFARIKLVRWIFSYLSLMPDSFSHLHNCPYVDISSNMNQKNLTIDYTIWCRVCRYRIFLFL